MSGCIIALDNQMAVLPVGVRETWRLIFSKCVMNAMVPEATNSCQDEHLCDILKVVIDRAISGAQYI